MKSQKQKGTYWERRIVSLLGDAGWTAMRSPGSLGPVDVIAFKPSAFKWGYLIRLIQAKTGRCLQLSRPEKIALMKLARQFPGAVEIWWTQTPFARRLSVDSRNGSKAGEVPIFLWRKLDSGETSRSSKST